MPLNSVRSPINIVRTGIKLFEDLVGLNFANPDMVGHTGDFSEVVNAVENRRSLLEICH
ncbi:hypothetical protein [Arcticibacterium luteifluviistationis]|uniref:hypothetical protein n=1 Tax=Arcticibacterium luteifluviistationis TaxID=1784714 RepID=UPI001E521FC2|nr:hypothetical protein [Arcticibacterium luteifluviistationis]